MAKKPKTLDALTDQRLEFVIRSLMRLGDTIELEANTFGRDRVDEIEAALQAHFDAVIKKLRDRLK